MRPVVSEVATTVRAPLAATFERVVPVDLPSVLRGYGPLPAVVATEDQTGPWDAVGQTRTVRLSDGTTAREELTAFDRPRHFGYRVGSFTGPLRFLTTGARGAWWFEPAGAGATRVRWRYAFDPRSALARPAVWALARLLWRGYMRAALRAVRAEVERAEPARGPAS